MISLADLEAMDRAGLAALWSDLIGGDVPPNMSQPMQRRFLAFEVQTRRHGGLPPALLAQPPVRRAPLARLERHDPCRRCPARWFPMERHPASLALGHRPRHHRRALVGSALLRAGCGGGDQGCVGGGREAWGAESRRAESRRTEGAPRSPRRSCAARYGPGPCGMTQKPVIRCAIYTRKSSDEGLDQSFNSLDAQHEAQKRK